MTLGFLLIMTPLIWWSPHDFLQMTLLTHASAKIRPDALNFTAFWFKTTGQELSPAVQGLAVFLGLMIALFHVLKNRTRRGISVIPEAWAIFFGFSIFFGKFAFCNYYWLLLSFCWMAVSESARADEFSSVREVPLRNSEALPVRKLRFF